jgi:VanZ family protein
MIKAWIWRWGPAILIMTIIFIASATPGSNLVKFGAWDFIIKKGGHMTGYALLAAAFFHALDRHQKSIRSPLIIAACLSLLYAASDEFHQKFTPGRTSTVSDVLIDMEGAVIGLAGMSLSRKKFRSQESE